MVPTKVWIIIMNFDVTISNAILTGFKYTKVSSTNGFSLLTFINSSLALNLNDAESASQQITLCLRQLAKHTKSANNRHPSTDARLWHKWQFGDI